MTPDQYREMIVARFGLRAEVRVYPDQYAVVTCFSPTGEPVFSVGLANRWGRWEVVGRSVDV